MQLSIDGRQLSADELEFLISVSLDEDSDKSDELTLVFWDPDLTRQARYLEDQVVAFSGGWRGDIVKMFYGTIATVEIDGPEDGVPKLTLKCLDMGVAMSADTEPRSWANMKDSDIAKSIAQSGSLIPVVQDTDKVYEQVVKPKGQSDMQFLQNRAESIGYECFISGVELHFHEKGHAEGSATKLEYRQGEHNLLSFNVRHNKGAKQLEVTTSDVDPETKEQSSHTASDSSSRPTAGTVYHEGGSTWSTGKSRGGPKGSW